MAQWVKDLALSLLWLWLQLWCEFLPWPWLLACHQHSQKQDKTKTKTTPPKKTHKRLLKVKKQNKTVLLRYNPHTIKFIQVFCPFQVSFGLTYWS